MEVDACAVPRLTMPLTSLKPTIAAMTTNTTMTIYSSIVCPLSSRMMALQAPIILRFMMTPSSPSCSNPSCIFTLYV
jgi:hypothetical protein